MLKTAIKTSFIATLGVSGLAYSASQISTSVGTIASGSAKWLRNATGNITDNITHNKIVDQLRVKKTAKFDPATGGYITETEKEITSIPANESPTIIAVPPSQSAQKPVDPLSSNIKTSNSEAAPTVSAQPEDTNKPTGVSSEQIDQSADSTKNDTTTDQNTKIDKNAVPVDAAKVDETAPPAAPEILPINDPSTWTLEQLNTSEWTGPLDKAPYPVLAKAQVLLSRLHTSPGAVDGQFGRNMLKAISAFEFMNGLKIDGQLDEESWKALNEKSTEPTFQNYTITKEDVDQKYTNIPVDFALQAKMPCLCYASVQEMLGEKFHVDQAFLQKLNSKSSFKEGDTIIVPNIQYTDFSPVKMLIAHKTAGQMYLFGTNNKMIGTLPITVGSPETPSPTGNHKIVAINPNPHYHYDPKNFIQGNNMSPLTLPKGPNSPVGVMWIGLSKPSYGLHGTPNPSSIDKTRSHGCVRLANWDAVYLSKRVRPGVLVKFID